jgi:hypothetical protein
MKIRKQVYDLKVEDLEQNPVWEFALDEEGIDGQDEATVRPVSIRGIVDPAEGMVVVRAGFTLADGTIMYGYLTPPTAEFGGLGTIQPQIITPLGQVSFWCGILKPTKKDLARRYEQLARTAEKVFPVRFQSDVQVAGGPVSGVLDGFAYMELEEIHTIV